MKTNFLQKRSWVLSLALLAIVGCKSNDPVTEVEPETETPVEGKFLVAAPNGDATYFMVTDDLEDANAEISPTNNNGYEYSMTFTHFVSNGTDGFVSLKYGSGNAHYGARFTIAEDGRATSIGDEFVISSGFSTAGSFGNVIYAVRSGQTIKDANNNDAKGAIVNRINMSSGGAESKSMVTTTIAGYEGQEASLIGVVDAGDGSFYTSLEFSGVNKAVIAKVNGTTLAVEALYEDDRLEVSGGRYRSARYAQIGNAEDGSVYVFSGAYTGDKKAGALLIKKGATGFDADYYWDIETASGGYHFRKIWLIKDDKFLVEFYNATGVPGNTAAASQFAVLDMSEKKLTWLQGVPDKGDIVDLGMKWPYAYNGKMYMPVTTASESRFYVLDPETATAVKGLKVTGVSGIDSGTFVAD